MRVRTTTPGTAGVRPGRLSGDRHAYSVKRWSSLPARLSAIRDTRCHVALTHPDQERPLKWQSNSTRRMGRSCALPRRRHGLAGQARRPCHRGDRGNARPRSRRSSRSVPTGRSTGSRRHLATSRSSRSSRSRATGEVQDLPGQEARAAKASRAGRRSRREGRGQNLEPRRPRNGGPRPASSAARTPDARADALGLVRGIVDHPSGAGWPAQPLPARGLLEVRVNPEDLGRHQFRPDHHRHRAPW